MICEHCNRHFDGTGAPLEAAEARAVDLTRLARHLVLCRECFHLTRPCRLCREPILSGRCRCCGKVVSGLTIIHEGCHRSTP